MNTSKQIPNFKTEAEERQFWEKHDSTDYLDWKQAKAMDISSCCSARLPTPKRNSLANILAIY